MSVSDCMKLDVTLWSAVGVAPKISMQETSLRPKMFAVQPYRLRNLDFYQWSTQEFCSGGGGSTNSVEDRGQRERGSGVGSPLVKGSGGDCNLVQEISFHIVKFS